MKAINLIEIGMPTLRTEILEKTNIEAFAKDLDMTDELHEAGAVRMASYQQITINLNNRQVRQCTCQAEDLVLRRVLENMADPASDKF